MLAEFIGVAQLNELTGRQTVLTDQVSVDDLQRFRQYIVPLPEKSGASDAAGINVRLRFRSAGDEALQPTLLININGVVGLECQRCLEPMLWQVNIDSELRLCVSGKMPEDEAELVDAVEVDDQGLHIRELIEDELLSAIPLAPKHAASECEVATSVAAPVETEAQVEGAHKPFTGLAELLKQDDPSKN